jgi:hypothetical protein
MSSATIRLIHSIYAAKKEEELTGHGQDGRTAESGMFQVHVSEDGLVLL